MGSKHQRHLGRIGRFRTSFGAIPAALLAAAPALADGGVQYVDISAGDGAGIDYRRIKSPRDLVFDQLKAQPVYTMDDGAITPIKSRGAPGVAILDYDYDNDGDLDIFVTNGPGRANSLDSNQLEETGTVVFVDVALVAGIDATAQDSSGVCFGDTDNDGDSDVLVLGTGEPNQFFVNNGDGTFSNVTALSDIGGGNRHSTGCSMGDFDGDGYLDIVVGNTYTDWSHQIPNWVEPYALNEHNQVFTNVGSNTFIDVSAQSGIEATSGFKPAADGSPTITWAIAAVDYDQDGDIDLG